MVLSVMRALLLQVFFTFHVYGRSDRMAAIMANAEDTLRELLKKEGKQLCGSMEIHKLLTMQASKRVTLWSKIDAIAAAELADLQRLLDDAEEQIATYKAAIAKKKSEEKPEMAVEEIAAMIKKALFEAGFDAASEDEALNSAKLSKCGKARRREQRKLGISPASGALDASKLKFNEMVAARMDQKDIRIQSDAIYNACELLELIPGDGGMTYCNEMCEQMSNQGSKISNDAVGQTAGAGSDQMQKKLDELTVLFQTYAARQGKCQEAAAALTGFKESVEPLEKAIEVTFDAWYKANANFNEAEGILDALGDDIEDSKEMVTQLTDKANAATKDVQEAKEALNQVRASEFICKTRLSKAKTKLNDAKKKMQDSDEALKAAEMIKQKVAGIIENAVTLYDWFVHEPLRNLCLDGDGALDIFDQGADEETTAKEAFQYTMQSVMAHCKNEAGPAFAKITSVNLAPLCQIPSDAGVDESVEQRKKEVKQEFGTAISFMKDLTPPQGSEQANEVAQPVMLDEVVDAFPKPTFASQYMPKWREDGPFLKAIVTLRLAIQGLADQTAQLEHDIGQVADSVKNNIKLRVAARKTLNEAIDAQKFAEEEKQNAEKLLASQEEQEEQQEADLNDLENIANGLYEKYKGALKTFDQHFVAGTKLALLETNRSKSSDGLKPVHRVA